MIPIHIKNEQDAPIGDAPLVFGAEIRMALMRCTGLEYDQTMKRHVAELTHQQIECLEISDQLRRKLTSLRASLEKRMDHPKNLEILFGKPFAQGSTEGLLSVLGILLGLSFCTLRSLIQRPVVEEEKRRLCERLWKKIHTRDWLRFR